MLLVSLRTASPYESPKRMQPQRIFALAVFRPIAGPICIEGSTSLYAVLKEVDKDPKEVIAA